MCQKEKDTLNGILEDEQLYISNDLTKIKFFPYEHDAFFVKEFLGQILFNTEQGNIKGFILNSYMKYDYEKLY